MLIFIKYRFKIIFIILSVILYADTHYGQSSGNLNPDAVIATIDENDLTLGELLNIYRNNHEADETDLGELRKFLPNFVEYRLKLRYAKENGLFEDPEILREFEEFGRESAYRYWLENEIKESIIETYSERYQIELKAFHILRELPETASPEDTLLVYNQLLEAREKLLEGITTEQVNQTYSSERNGQLLGGDLPWITAGRTVEPFEDVLFALDTGEVSLPVRTQFGYHIIYLQEKRPRTSDRQLRHIFFQKLEGHDPGEVALQVYDSLTAGADWNNMVQNHTDDHSTRNRSGQIGWVGYAMKYPEDFVDAAMKLSRDEPFSEPIEMSYGYHIVRVDSVRTFPSEEKYREQIIAELEQLQRLTPGRDHVHRQMKEKHGFQLHRDHLDKLHKILKNSHSESAERFASLDELTGLPLINFKNRTHTIGYFLDYLLEQGIISSFLSDQETILDDFTDKIIKTEIIGVTKELFPQFEQEVQNYLDGLVVFRVSEQNIWNYETADRDELYNYFQQNRDEYQLDQHYHYYSIRTVSDSTAAELQELIRTGELQPGQIEGYFENVTITADSTSNLNSSQFELLSELNEGEFSDVIKHGSVHNAYFLKHISEPRFMTFEDAFNRVFSDYLPLREKKFINYLKEKYPVKTYPENITFIE
ncbi:MAG: peptidylprolyl isomerase [Balneolaceae bacterium]|nr:peptidylprolyl isomerase [Balneolaceae bacterium]